MRGVLGTHRPVPHVTFVRGVENKVEAMSLGMDLGERAPRRRRPDLPAEDVSTSLYDWANVLDDRPSPHSPAVTAAGEEADILAVEVVDEPWFRPPRSAASAAGRPWRPV
jgi:hypothetical protein